MVAIAARSLLVVGRDKCYLARSTISALLMEAGVSYNKQRLHKAGYFRELLASNPDIDEGLRARAAAVMPRDRGAPQKTERALVRSLESAALLIDRVERLMTIPAVGPITALTWALEVREVQRFPSIRAISYCGLCGAEKSSGSTVQRTPLSKQRNKHLQTTLIEAAKMAPRNSPALAMLYDQKKQKGNANRATLAVARKLVAYLVAVDRRQKEFLTVERENRTAA